MQKKALIQHRTALKKALAARKNAATFTHPKPQIAPASSPASAKKGRLGLPRISRRSYGCIAGIVLGGTPFVLNRGAICCT